MNKKLTLITFILFGTLAMGFSPTGGKVTTEQTSQIAMTGQGASIDYNNKLNFGIGYVTTGKLFHSEKTSSSESITPTIDARFASFFIKGANLGYDIFHNPLFSASIFFNGTGGYKIKPEDMEEGYKSIHERKSQPAIGGRVAVAIPFVGVDASGNYQIGEHGSNTRIEVAKFFPLSKRFFAGPVLSVSRFSSEYVNYYFGVEENEVGGKIKNSYSTNSANAYGYGVACKYFLTTNFVASGSFGAQTFSKEISDSPIVKNKTLTFGVLSLQYKFGGLFNL